MGSRASRSEIEDRVVMFAFLAYWASVFADISPLVFVASAEVHLSGLSYVVGCQTRCVIAEHDISPIVVVVVVVVVLSVDSSESRPSRACKWRPRPAFRACYHYAVQPVFRRDKLWHRLVLPPISLPYTTVLALTAVGVVRPSL